MDNGDVNEDEEEEEDDDIFKLQKFEVLEYKRFIFIYVGKSKGGLKVVLKVDFDYVRRFSLSE